jgi:uncharacterized protein (DUF885 family)
MNRRIIFSLVLSIIFLTLPNSCTQEVQINWDDFVTDFVESYFYQNPDWATFNGRHEFDGQIADYSDKGIRARVEWFKEQKYSADKFNNADLNGEQLLEKKNLLRIIDENIFSMEILRKPYFNADYYFWQLAPSLYLEKNYAPLKQRMTGYIKYLHSMKIVIEQIRNNFENQPSLSRYDIETAIITFGGFSNFMKKDAPIGFESIINETLWSEFKKATEETVYAFEEFVKWLDTRKHDATDNFAMGSEKFSKMLYATDRIDMPLTELIELAENDLQRNQNALKDACQKYSPGKSVKECIQMIQSQKKEYNPIEIAREQLATLKNFVKDKNLVAIPEYEKLSVLEAPPFMSGSSALINLPRAFDKNSEGFYYISHPNPKWSKKQRISYLKDENYLLFTSVHEVWPGHFLQSLYYNKNRSLLAKVFLNYTNLEGWAHYCEEMMFDEGLGNYQPEYEIGMRIWALQRDVRFVVSIKLHTEGISVKDAEQLFINYAFLDSITANMEAIRAIWDPQYYGYTLGKILIRNLKDKWMAKTGINNLNEFHTKFLSYGVIPISLIEKDMLDTK